MLTVRDVQGAAGTRSAVPIDFSRRAKAQRTRAVPEGAADVADSIAAIEAAEAMAMADGRPLLAARLGLVRALALQGEGRSTAAAAAAGQALHTTGGLGLRRLWPGAAGCGESVLCGSLASSLGVAERAFLQDAAQLAEGRAVAAGKARVALPKGFEPLSARELEILELLGKALSTKSIARLLDLSAGTVKWHLRNVYGKLQAASRENALAKARELRIVD